MVDLTEYIEEIEKLNKCETNINQCQTVYRDILSKVKSYGFDKLGCDSYMAFCNKSKNFLNQTDIDSPASRLSLAKGSFKYISDMLSIIWDNELYNEQKIVDELSQKYQYTEEDYSKLASTYKSPFIRINPRIEINKVLNYFIEFVSLHDKFKVNDDLSTIKLMKIVHKIINKIMYYYLSEDLTVKLLKSWELAQPVIYPFDEEYRDHLIHQFYVFLLGCTMLDKLQKRIFQNWNIKEPVGRPLEEIKRRTFRSWLSASLFHDVGYIATKLKIIGESVVDQFFSNLPSVKLQTFKLNCVMNKMLKNYLICMDKVHYQNEFNYTHSVGKLDGEGAIIIKSQMDKMDHGTLSSYMFWNTILQDIKNIQVRYVEVYKNLLLTRALIINALHYGEEPGGKIAKFGDYTGGFYQAKKEDEKKHNLFKIELEEDIAISSYAIAVHNIKKYHKISFEDYPLAFLLILCDELQQWGRVSMQGEKPQLIPNELLDCKVFLKDEDNHELISYIKELKNIDSIKELIEPVSNDIIFVKFKNIKEDYQKKFKTKLKEIFTHRLKNGPSLIVTNQDSANNDEILFLAKIDENEKYKTYFQ